MANFHHNNRNHGYRGRGRKNQNIEKRENKEVREDDDNKGYRENRARHENKERHDQQEARAMYRERRERENREPRENKDRRERRENRENSEMRESREVRESKDSRNNRESRDNQAISTFTLGSKELEGKNAEFQYDKGWYSITDIIGEEKNVIYKSKNAQEAYTKWNVYIGRKKERPQRAEKVEN